MDIVDIVSTPESELFQNGVSSAVALAEAPDQVQETRRERALELDYEQLRNARKGYRFIKRVQDVLLSALALVVLAAPMGVLALIIWMDSPGASPFFVQKRVGLNGREFRFYKFRSMVPHAEEKLKEVLAMNEMQGPVFKMKDDPRITRVGKFIRKTSIDELPQLINILKGEMSIVGPRPALPREVEQYNECHRQRLYVTPGLTCYWQVQPRRNDLTFDEWLDLDIKYIKERSFLTDWKIILRTFGAVVGAEGE